MTKRLIIMVFLAVAVGACKETPTTPTPTPVPLPTPAPSGCCTLSGAVTETWPTTTTPIAGATITITSGANTGQSTVADDQGRYTLTGLQVGPLGVRSSAPGYVDATQAVTLSADRPGFVFEMNPVAEIVDERRDGEINDTNPVCESLDSTTQLPCIKYLVALHSEGRLEAVLNWDDRIELSSALALELVRETATGPQQIALSRVTQGNPNRLEVIATLPPGLYTVRVLYQRPVGPLVFILTMSHPR